MLRRRLYLQIYFTIIVSLVIVVASSALLWGLFGRDNFNRDVFDAVGRLAYLSLPAADAPQPLQAAAVQRLGRELGIDISLFDSDRRLVAAYGEATPPPSGSAGQGGWQHEHRGARWSFSLPDARWLVVDRDSRGFRFTGDACGRSPRGGHDLPVRLAVVRRPWA